MNDFEKHLKNSSSFEEAANKLYKEYGIDKLDSLRGRQIYMTNKISQPYININVSPTININFR